MATHSSTLAWKIPGTEGPGGLQSMGSLRVGHDWATSLSLSCVGGGNGNPLQRSCLENPRDGRAWWAAVYGAAQSRTRLKRLSSRARVGKMLACCLDKCFSVMGSLTQVIGQQICHQQVMGYLEPNPRCHHDWTRCGLWRWDCG